jgi:hypothetical protein
VNQAACALLDDVGSSSSALLHVPPLLLLHVPPLLLLHVPPPLLLLLLLVLAILKVASDLVHQR